MVSGFHEFSGVNIVIFTLLVIIIIIIIKLLPAMIVFDLTYLTR